MPHAASTPNPSVFQQWQQLAPTFLPAKKEAQEQSAARRMAKQNPLALAHATQMHTQHILLGLVTLKQNLTYNRWPDVFAAAEALKAPVHQLRICLRAQQAPCDLPPRMMQFGHVHASAAVLAFAHGLDTFLTQSGRDPGPLILLWNMQCAVRAVPPASLAYELQQVAQLRQDQQLLAQPHAARSANLRQARLRKQSTFNQGYLLDEVAHCMQVARDTPSIDEWVALYERTRHAAVRLRAAIRTHQHPQTPLPPHPEQYSMAGNNWAVNRRHWRNALTVWFEDVDEAVPPAYASHDRFLPTYQHPQSAPPCYRQHQSRLTWPLSLYPRRLLLRLAVSV